VALVGFPVRHLLCRPSPGAGRADRGGPHRGRDLLPDDPLRAASGHHADHHADDDHDRHLVVLVFDFVYILTQGGPAYSSEVLSTLAYRSAFYDLAVGKAAAVSVVISLFGLAATVLYIRAQASEFEQ